jgi:hypothetical protein
MVKVLYAVWVKIDETMPWIELKGEYVTKSEAEKAARRIIERIKVKIKNFPEKRTPMKAIAPIRAR